MTTDSPPEPTSAPATDSAPTPPEPPAVTAAPAPAPAAPPSPTPPPTPPPPPVEVLPAAAPAPAVPVSGDIVAIEERVDQDALRFYLGLGASGARVPAGDLPFMLLDAKSMPRSGLHFLERALAQIFQDEFSFCEQYNEVGCCRRYPCALTGFAADCRVRGVAHVRLVKSHDFDLRDPRYLLGRRMERLILTRDPLSLLTSLFALDELARHGSVLRGFGVDVAKILYKHEPAVLSMGWTLLDLHFQPRPADDVARWLQDRAEYLRKFAAKWLPRGTDNPRPSRELHVKYPDVPAYLTDLVTRMSTLVSGDKAAAWSARAQTAAAGFAAREDVFVAPSMAVTDELVKYRRAFEAVADQLRPLW